MKVWLLVLATLCHGCVIGFLNDTYDRKHRFESEEARIKAAVQARNHVELEYFIDHSDFTNNGVLARKEYLRIRRQQLAAASCDAVERELSSRSNATAFDDFHDYAQDEDEKKTIHGEFLVKLADCKSPRLFTTMALGKDDAGQQLVELEQQGKPVYAAFLALVRSPDADYIESATFTWLDKTKTSAICPELERVGDVNDGTRDFLLGFYSTKGCRAEVVRTSRVLVSSRFPSARMHACNAMRSIGDSSLLPQMKILAEGDTTAAAREACQDAINELRTKAMSRR